MNEYFKLDLGHFPDFPQLFKGEFPGQVDPANSLVLPEMDTEGVGRVGLGAEMQRNVRGPAFGEEQERPGH